MNVIGIVAEYNPFHFGHNYHIIKSKEQLGDDSIIICAMSGDFVQRGEAALYSKFARAEAAVRSGADLVLELPLPWALSSAENFARGAVSLLAAAGATHLSFGSESGNIEELDKLAELLCSSDINERIKAVSAEDATLTYAAARQQVLSEAIGESAALLAQPNNILAVEYLKAIKTLNLQIKPITVCRKGAGHDEQGNSSVPSAMEIRRRIINGEITDGMIPESAATIYNIERKLGREQKERERIELAVLSRLRMLPREVYEALPDASNGVGKRLYDAAMTEPSLDAVLAASKTKRYAMSRMRRMCMCAALGVTAEMTSGTPPYIRVLAATNRGCELLRKLNDNENGRPVITKPAAVKAMTDRCRDVFAVGASAHDLYVLGYTAEQERKGGGDWKTSPKIVNNV